MTVHQVVADGLPSEFPPLRSLGSFAGNLPQQLSSFVGRDQLLADVADLVRSNRLVTLSGVGGVGKTRLALEVGAEMADEFPDGVWLVELAPVGDPSSVPAAIATALGITPQGDVELIDTVAEARRRPTALAGGRQLRARARRRRRGRSDRSSVGPGTPRSWPPRASTCGSPARRCCRSRLWRSMVASPPTRSSCSSSGPARPAPASACTTRRAPRR